MLCDAAHFVKDYGPRTIGPKRAHTRAHTRRKEGLFVA
jgi:hypothetical protein